MYILLYNVQHTFTFIFIVSRFESGDPGVHLFVLCQITIKFGFERKTSGFSSFFLLNHRYWTIFLPFWIDNLVTLSSWWVMFSAAVWWERLASHYHSIFLSQI